MLEYLKINSVQIYRILLAIVVVGKISNWFLNYSDETNKILSTAMFCLIGMAYLVLAWAFDKFILKLIFLSCGLYLIVLNFLANFGWNSIIGIVCVLTPIIIGRFLPEEDGEDKIVAEYNSITNKDVKNKT